MIPIIILSVVSLSIAVIIGFIIISSSKNPIITDQKKVSDIKFLVPGKGFVSK